jgi:putative membrane protein
MLFSMNILFKMLCGLCALTHFWFMALEMYFWSKPLGLKTFKMTLEKAQSSEVLAMNQGLYNGFLAAGIVYGLICGETQITVFCLVCIVLAGIFGALTVSPRIFFLQGLPALIALGIYYKGTL